MVPCLSTKYALNRHLGGRCTIVTGGNGSRMCRDKGNLQELARVPYQ